MNGYRWRGEDQQRAREVAETLAIAREIAAGRVPDWEPWMTVERGYAGMLRPQERDAQERLERTKEGE